MTRDDIELRTRIVEEFVLNIAEGLFRKTFGYLPKREYWHKNPDKFHIAIRYIASHGRISTRFLYEWPYVNIEIIWAGHAVENKRFNIASPHSKRDITRFVSETYIKIKKRKYKSP